MPIAAEILVRTVEAGMPQGKVADHPSPEGREGGPDTGKSWSLGVEGRESDASR
jgi:hypothetical protein